jgi:predicted amidohydrolase YtcJ
LIDFFSYLAPRTDKQFIAVSNQKNRSEGCFRIGSLEVGKFADLVELSADITAVNPNEFLDKVKITVTK